MWTKDSRNAWIARHPEQHRQNRRRANARWIRKYPEKVRLKNRLWKQNNRERSKELNRQSYKRHKFKHRAREAVRQAILKGFLERPVSCEQCGKACKPEAHHFKGYAKEFHLTIQWLCTLCHGVEHRTVVL